MNSENNQQGSGNMPKPPTVLDGLLQPGFPAKVFTVFFLNDCMVFAKTGSFGTAMGSTMQASLGGFTGAGMIAGAVGGLADAGNASNRADKAAGLAGLDPQQIVAAHKNNLMVPYGALRGVELKGPNFAGELKVIVDAGSSHKFRMDKQSKASAAYVEKVFNEFLPGKVRKR
ncbi:MAG: hypothetical protein ABIJ16_02725 [Bacteroidota bacterium]